VAALLKTADKSTCRNCGSASSLFLAVLGDVRSPAFLLNYGYIVVFGALFAERSAFAFACSDTALGQWERFSRDRNVFLRQQ